MTASQQHTHPAVTAALHNALYRIPEAMELLSLSRTVILEPGPATLDRRSHRRLSPAGKHIYGRGSGRTKSLTLNQAKAVITAQRRAASGRTSWPRC